MTYSRSMFTVVATLLLIAQIPLHALELLGAGATFPYPFYAKITSEYNKKTGIKINYQSIGSGGGIQQLKNQTVDFGASDAFLTAEEAKTMKGKVLHIPTCLGAVAVSFNLPGVNNLNLTDAVVADIFLGTITKWNDPKIAKLNPKVALPALPITTVHRSDGSGTTAIFTGYLANNNAAWSAKCGAGKTINWPNGVGGKGNAGVAGLIKQVPGSIGYIEHIYAKQNKMSVAAINNKSGEFVLPNVEQVSRAAAGVKIPADTRISISESSVKKGYPISGLTWLLIYQDLGDLSPEKAKELKKFLSWTIHDGQAFADSLDYAPLPKEAVAIADKILATVTYKGKKI